MVENVVFANAPAALTGPWTIYAGRLDSYGHLVIRGCTFSYPRVDGEPISLRSEGQTELSGNTFIADEISNRWVNYNVDFGKVLWASDNVARGLVGPKNQKDTQTVLVIAASSANSSGTTGSSLPGR